MTRNELNFLIDSLAFLSFTGVCFTGILLAFFIGSGPNPQLPKVFWGLHRHDWGDIHFYFALTTGVLLLLHFLLHWSWFQANCRRLIRLPAFLFLALLLAGAGGGLLLGGSLVARTQAHRERIAHEKKDAEERNESARGAGAKGQGRGLRRGKRLQAAPR